MPWLTGYGWYILKTRYTNENLRRKKVGPPTYPAIWTRHRELIIYLLLIWPSSSCLNFSTSRMAEANVASSISSVALNSSSFMVRPLQHFLYRSWLLAPNSDLQSHSAKPNNKSFTKFNIKETTVSTLRLIMTHEYELWYNFEKPMLATIVYIGTSNSSWKWNFKYFLVKNLLKSMHSSHLIYIFHKFFSLPSFDLIIA